MIPRLLVPKDARPPAADVPSTRRRPSSMDERTLVPAMLPIVPLDGKSNIPTSLPLDAIATRVVVPRDVKWEEIVHEDNGLPVQPTDLDERITVPQGAAPPEVITPSENIPRDMIDVDVFMTGEVNLLSEPAEEEKTKWSVITRVSSVAFHVLLIAFLLFQPKLFPPRPRTQQEIDLGNRLMTVLVPREALQPSRPTPRPRPPAVHVDPKIIRKVAPPEPTPAPKLPEVAKELPSAPVPQPKTPAPQTPAPVAKAEAPKLEAPDQTQTQHNLLLPKSHSLADSIREASRNPGAQGGMMSAPLPHASGSQGGGSVGGGGRGNIGAGATILTPTEGVDFSDYIHRMLASIQRNWYAVMPESAMLGDRGKVVLQYKIMKNGSVPGEDPLRVMGSGKEPLDRAAVSAIKSSNPFEPLPSAFSGPFIEIQIIFLYNLPTEAAYQ